MYKLKTIYLNFARTEEIHQWIINDGPVDAVWIENLNTVLDDNKMLCLANSERIKLTAWVHMVFEVQDLAQASPATVSRCGMVYVDPDDLGWLPLVDSWRASEIESKLTVPQMEFLYQLFVKYFNKLLKWANKYGTYMIHQVTSAKMRLLCELLASLIEQKKWLESTDAEYKPLISKMFCWSVLWSVASNFKDSEKDGFERQIREVLGGDSDFE